MQNSNNVKHLVIMKNHIETFKIRAKLLQISILQLQPGTACLRTGASSTVEVLRKKLKTFFFAKPLHSFHLSTCFHLILEILLKQLIQFLLIVLVGCVFFFFNVFIFLLCLLF